MKKDIPPPPPSPPARKVGGPSTSNEFRILIGLSLAFLLGLAVGISVR